jgi:hypothetical protein
MQVQLAPDPDPDQDQLTTVEELQIGTDPFNPDSDADGMPDGWEWTHRFNPLDPGDARQDADEDGLSNLAEYQNQTDPWNRDTDDDSLPDLWEVEMGLDPRMSLGIHGPSGDPDGDIASNYHEFLAGTHPRDAASVLRLTISSAGESRARISWLTVRGRKYQLQQATSVLKLFEDILDPTFPRMGTGELESFLQDLTDEEGTARIYRLKIVP